MLLRHAKAGWAAPGMRDFDRPLDESGWRDAEAIGAAMAGAGYVPDLVLCSSAARARQTLEAAQRALATSRITFSDGLYATDAGGYLEIIQQVNDANTVLVVGHNPMMEDLGMALSGDGVAEANDTLAAGFPTAGLAVLRFDSPISAISTGSGYLEAFISPATA